jgi:steroid delta-isomerase-like uncharacterized protein
MRGEVLEQRVFQLVRDYVAAWNSHSVDRLAGFFAEKGSYAEFGSGRIMLGRQDIQRYLIATFDALPDLTLTPTGEPLSRGEHLYWRWLMTATHKGEFAGVPPTGKRFELRGLSVLLRRGDKIVRCADYFDVASVAGRAASGNERSWNDAGSSTHAMTDEPNVWLASAADEDNIGYGE